ncbi:hypothetical protein [Ralstonia pseudosolanacearum]|nr:hypothetical protein [Ralstonia pseudosolanacearum]UWD89253.1 hypothetical protein NY025_03855 [Ralstonia pseudosolanacearum]
MQREDVTDLIVLQKIKKQLLSGSVWYSDAIPVAAINRNLRIRTFAVCR